MISFDTAGFNIDGILINALNFPTQVCLLTSNFAPNQWTHLTLGVSDSPTKTIEYMLDGVSICDANTGFPGSTLNPMAFIIRPAGSTTPSKITLSHLKISKTPQAYMFLNNLLNYYSPLMHDTQHIDYLFHIPFNQNQLDSF